MHYPTLRILLTGCNTYHIHQNNNKTHQSPAPPPAAPFAFRSASTNLIFPYDTASGSKALIAFKRPRSSVTPAALVTLSEAEAVSNAALSLPESGLGPATLDGPPDGTLIIPLQDPVAAAVADADADADVVAIGVAVVVAAVVAVVIAVAVACSYCSPPVSLLLLLLLPLLLSLSVRCCRCCLCSVAAVVGVGVAVGVAVAFGAVIVVVIVMGTVVVVGVSVVAAVGTGGSIESTAALATWSMAISISRQVALSRPATWRSTGSPASEREQVERTRGFRIFKFQGFKGLGFRRRARDFLIYFLHTNINIILSISISLHYL
jgi:hypothetical protein